MEKFEKREALKAAEEEKVLSESKLEQKTLMLDIQLSNHSNPEVKDFLKISKTIWFKDHMLKYFAQNNADIKEGVRTKKIAYEPSQPTIENGNWSHRMPYHDLRIWNILYSLPAITWTSHREEYIRLIKSLNKVKEG